MQNISELCERFEKDIDENPLPLIISYRTSVAKKLLLTMLLKEKQNWSEVYKHLTKPQCPDFKDNGAEVLNGWSMLLEEYRQQIKEIHRLPQRIHLMQLMREILAT